MKKIILIDPFGLYVPSFIKQWEIIALVVATPQVKERISSDTNIGTLIFDINDLFNLSHQSGVSDALLKRYASIEGTFLYNNLRFYSSAPKLRYVYYNCLAFWDNLFSLRKPHMVFSTTDLHGEIFDLIPLEMAGVLGIPSYFSPPVSSYSFPLSAVVSYQTRKIIKVEDPRIDEVRIKLNLFEGAGKQDFYTRYLERLTRWVSWDKPLFGFTSILFKLIKRLNYAIFGYMFVGIFFSLFKSGKLDYHTGDDVVIIKSHHSFIHALSSYLYMVSGAINWSRISSPSVPDGKFIYFPLHMEPEAVLVNSRLNQQLYLAELIAQSLPDDWKLVVKEHPHQFKLNKPHMYYFLINLRIMKWFGAYSILRKNKRVNLLDHKQKSSDILAKASAVFSVSGSSILESIFVRVPVACSKGSFYASLSDVVVEIESKDDMVAFLRAVNDAPSTGANCEELNLNMGNLYVQDSVGAELVSRVLKDSIA